MEKEEKLIQGCQRDDAKSQEELYALYSRKMYVVCLRYSKSQQEAEDILQEAFIKVFDHIKKFRQDSRLEYWIKKIVVNTALNSQRSKLYMFPMVDVSDLPTQDEREVVLSGFHFKELLAMIQALPEGCQVIFNMYAIEGYSHREIADELGIAIGTSKSQYARAKSLLRELIKKAEKVSYGEAR